jgi:protein TonB
MELKKTNKANLEKQRTLFFEIGLLIALGVVLAAFEWGTPYNSNIEIITGAGGAIEPEQAPVTIPDTEKKTPPRVISDILNITEIDFPDVEGPVFFDPEGDIPNFPITGTYQAPSEENNDVIAKEFEVDVQAQFMDGGTDKFLKWVMEHIKYPEVAENNNIEGRVSVSFVIDKKGNLTNIKILRDIDQSLTEETIRVLNMSPTWKPAIKKGRVISVEYQMPVHFKLNK